MKKYEYSFGRTADGILSNVKGYATETNNFGESAFGILNKSTIDEDNFTTTDVVTSDKASIFTVGNGTSINDRRNIIELKSNGDTYIVNVGGYDGTNADEADAITILTDIENIHDDIERIDNTIESIHIKQDPDNHLIYTLLIDGENRGTINIPKDQFLKSVRYDNNTNELIFVFVTTDDENKEIRINITDLEDIYYAGNGLRLNDHTFSVVIDPTSEDYITVTKDGIKIQGIDNINKELNDLILNHIVESNAKFSELDLKNIAQDNAFNAYKISNDAEITSLEEKNISQDQIFAEYKSTNDARISAAELVMADHASANDTKFAELDLKNADQDAALKAYETSNNAEIEALKIKNEELDQAFSDHVSANNIKFQELDTKDVEIETALNNYKTSNDAEISALKQKNVLQDTEFAEYKTSNDTEIATLKLKNTTQDEALNSYKTSNDSRVKAVEDELDAVSVEIDSRIQEIIGAAPDALDTLKELADALGNDADFATTVTNNFAQRDIKDAAQDKALEDYKTSNNARVKAVEDDLDAYKTSNDAAFTSYKTETSNRLNIIESKNSEQDDRLDAVESDLDTYKISNDARIKAVEDKNVELDSTFEEYKNSNNQKIADLETKNTEQDTALAEYKTSNDSRVKLVEDSLSTYKTSNDSEIAELKSKNTSQDEALNSYKTSNNTRVSAIETKNTSQDERLNSIESDLNTLIGSGSGSIQDLIDSSIGKLKGNVSEGYDTLEEIENGITGIKNNYATKIELNEVEAKIPTKVSELNNDSGYLTAAQVSTAISSLIDSAPETLNTLNDLAAALGDDPNFATTITNLIAGKADVKHTHVISDVTNLQSSLDNKSNVGHTHTISQISDLHTNWDNLLKSTPSSYLTRWPSISEVTNKLNIIVKLNGGTTEGTNQFTYNGSAAKTINITASGIGAATSGHNHDSSYISAIGISGNNLTVTKNDSISNITVPYATNAGSASTANNATNASNANKVSNSLTLKINSGTTEGTNQYSFNGSAAKTLNIKAGGNVSLSAGSGTLTISSTNTTYGNATTSTSGLMSSTDKAKLDGIASGANKTTVDSVLSGSSTNPVQNKVINSALAGKANSSHTHTASQVSGLATVATSGSYNDLSNKPAAYSLPTASSSTKGGILIGFTESGKNYPVELDSNSKAFVNVPWTDTNTTYSNATSSTAGLMSANDKSKLDGIASGANKYTHPTSSGNKHIPSGGSSGQILRWSADGTAVWGNDNNTTYSAFKGATSSAAGGSGLVPAPAKGDNSSKYLKADGTWATPPNTAYSTATSSANGLMSSTDKAKLDGIASGATKITVDSSLSSTSTNPVQNKVINSALAGKAASSHTHAASQVTGLTANRALMSDGNGHPTVSAVTSTELGYLDGVTSNIQTQLNNRATTSSVSKAISEATFNTGHNTITSLSNVPSTKRLVFANIGSNLTLTTASISDGREIHIIVRNTSSKDIVITLPVSSQYISMNGDSLTVKASSNAEINIISDGVYRYIRTI